MSGIYKFQQMGQGGSAGGCTGSRRQLERMGETILLSSSSFGGVSATENKAGRVEGRNSSCAMVVSKSLLCSVDVDGQKGQETSNGEGPSGGLSDRSLVQRRDQEAEVTGLHGFWAENRSNLSDQARVCITAAWGLVQSSDTSQPGEDIVHGCEMEDFFQIRIL